MATIMRRLACNFQSWRRGRRVKILTGVEAARAVGLTVRGGVVSGTPAYLAGLDRRGPADAHEAAMCGAHDRQAAAAELVRLKDDHTPRAQLRRYELLDTLNRPPTAHEIQILSSRSQ